MLEQMAHEVRERIDRDILTITRAEAILTQEAAEKALREEYPSLMESWEEYQVKLRLIHAGQSSR